MEFVTEAGLVLVPLRLDGIDRELWFVLDTGAPTMLPTALAAELGIDGGDAVAGTDGAGAKFGAIPVELPGLRVGDLHVEDVAAVVTSAELPTSLCHALDGVLGVGLAPGSGFLDRHAVQIDYAKERLVIAEPGAQLGDDGTTLPLRRSHFDAHGEEIVDTFSEVWIVAEGQRGWVTLDTGYSGDIRVSEGLFAQLGHSLDEQGVATRRGAAIEYLGGDGPDMQRESRLRSLELGRLHVTDVPVAIEPHPDAGFGAMLLGYGLLRNFTVVVDYPGGELRLTPVPGSDPSAVDPELGLGVEEVAGRIEVVTLLDGGAADRAGIQLGDEVREFGGTAVKAGDHDGLCVVQRRVDDMPDDAPVSVRVRRGERMIDVQLLRKPALAPVRR